MIGLFVNTLIFRGDFTADLTFRDVIRQVRSFALEAYAHQDVPFEKLVEELVPQRSLDAHPLFQVMFTFQNIPKQVFEIPGLSIKEMSFEAGIAKFDLSVEVWEDSEFHCQFEYNTDLFRALRRCERMLGHFERLIEAALENPDLPFAAAPDHECRGAGASGGGVEPDCGRLSQRFDHSQRIRTPGGALAGGDRIAVCRHEVDLSAAQRRGQPARAPAHRERSGTAAPWSGSFWNVRRKW